MSQFVQYFSANQFRERRFENRKENVCLLRSRHDSCSPSRIRTRLQPFGPTLRCSWYDHDDKYSHGFLPYWTCFIDFSVLVELHLEKNDWVVKMFYHNESNREPFPLTIKGCSTSCPLPLLPKLWADELLDASNYR